MHKPTNLPFIKLPRTGWGPIWKVMKKPETEEEIAVYNKSCKADILDERIWVLYDTVTGKVIYQPIVVSGFSYDMAPLIKDAFARTKNQKLYNYDTEDLYDFEELEEILRISDKPHPLYSAGWSVYEDGKDKICVIHIYKYVTEDFLPKNKPEEWRELFRICMTPDGEIWEENKEGAHAFELTRRKRDFLRDIRWVAKPADREFCKILHLKCFPERNMSDDLFDPRSLAYSIVLRFLKQPRKERVYKRVPQIIADDVKAQERVHDTRKAEEDRFLKSYCGELHVSNILPFCEAFFGDDYIRLIYHPRPGTDREIYEGYSELVYITDTNVFFFMWYPVSRTYASVSLSKNLILMYADGLSLLAGYYDRAIPQKKYKGLALLLYDELCNLKSEYDSKPHCVPDVLPGLDEMEDEYDELPHGYAYNILRSVMAAKSNLYIEQLLKMHYYYLAMEETYHKQRYDKTEGTLSLPEHLGVRGSQLKHIMQFIGCRPSSGYYTVFNEKSRTARVFERFNEAGISVDPLSYYKALINGGSLLIDILTRYAGAGKNPKHFLRSLNIRRNSYDTQQLMQNYRDYLRMRTELGTESDLPEFLKLSQVRSMHRIVTRDYNRWQQLREIKRDEQTLKMFERRVKSKEYKSLIYRDDDFLIRAPEKPEDLVVEGNELSHCVGSYVGAVSKGISKIYFLRKTEKEDKPYCTLEVKKDGANALYTLTQCYNAHDKHDDNVDRIEFIRKWAKDMGITIKCEL